MTDATTAAEENIQTESEPQAEKSEQTDKPKLIALGPTFQVLPPLTERPDVFAPLFAGFLVIVIFFGGVAAWSLLAPLQSAAIAQGFVNLEGYRKTLQHLEGGIVDKIYVREGDAVKKGQVLIELDQTHSRSKIELLNAQLQSFKAQLDLIKEELLDLEDLFSKGLARKSRLLSVKRRQAELLGLQDESLAQKKVAQDIITRSQIRAPLDGTVLGLKVHTKGGVIKPSDPLLFIVPKDEPLVIEARINPNDIDIVHKDLEARVRLTPLNARDTPPFKGRVTWVSADRLSEGQSDIGYYLARVEITEMPETLPKGVKLFPGMPAEVMIVTGERSFFDYLISPIERSFRKAFREE